MKIQKKLVLSFLLIWLIYPLTSGQSFNWRAGIDGFFDNREYYNTYAQAQTLFGIRTFGISEFSFNKYHKIGVGLDILYEFGYKLRCENIKPVAYWWYNKAFIDLRFGAFPRKKLIQLPLFLQSDTIQYYRPNCEGMFLQLSQPWGYQSVWLDWTSLQTETNRESFQIGGTGLIRKGILFYRHDFIMTHYARPANANPDDYIRDNGGLYAGIGADLSDYLFDSLTLSIGYCFSYDRLREVYDLSFYHGTLTQLYIELSNFGIRSTLYFGNGQVQLWGDQLYGANYYNRIDFIWHIFKKENIKCCIEFSLHTIEDDLDVSQLFKISALLKNKKSHYPDNIY